MRQWRRTRMAELKEKDVSRAAAKKVAQNRTRWKAMGLMFRKEMRRLKKKIFKPRALR